MDKAAKNLWTMVFLLIIIFVFFMVTFINKSLNRTLLNLFGVVFLVIAFAMLLYFFTRKMKEIYLKTTDEELKEKRLYRVYYGHYFNWLRKNWFIIIPIMLVYTYLETEQLLFCLLGGFVLIIIGLFEIFAIRKRLSFVVDSPLYKIWTQGMDEKRAIKMFYFFAVLMITFGIVLLVYSFL